MDISAAGTSASNSLYLKYIKPSVFLWLVILFTFTRICFLYFTDPNTLFYNIEGEELYKGAVAKEFLEAPILSYLPFFQYDYNAGGAFVISLMISVSFYFFGPTVFALKLAPLFIASVTLYVWLRITERYCGLKAAFIFSLLYILAPSSFTRFNLVTMGYHSDTILFTALVVLLLHLILNEKRDSWHYHALLGFVMGFGLFYNYLFAITIITALLYSLFFCRSLILRKEFFLLLFFFVLGFSPWFLVHGFDWTPSLVVHNKGPLDILDPKNISFFFAQGDNSFLFHFLNSFNARFVDMSASFFFNKAYLLLLVIFLISIIYLFVTNKKNEKKLPPQFRVEWFVLIFFVVFAFVYQLSFTKATRYLMLLFPLLFFLISYYSNTIFLRKGSALSKKIALMWIAVFILTNICSNASQSLTGKGEAFSLKGYSYKQPQFRCKTIEECEKLYNAFEQRLNEEEKIEFYREKSRTLARLAVNRNDPKEEALKIIRKNPVEFRSFFYKELGRSLIHNSRELSTIAMTGKTQSLETSFNEMKGLRKHFPKDGNLVYLDVGFIYQLDSQKTSNLSDLIFSLKSKDQERYTPFAFRALGSAMTGKWIIKGDGYSGIKANLKKWQKEKPMEEQVAYFTQGIGMALYKKWNYQNHHLYDFIPKEFSSFSKETRKNILIGIGIQHFLANQRQNKRSKINLSNMLPLTNNQDMIHYQQGMKTASLLLR